MGCSCECIAKVFMVLLNVLTGIIGFALLVAGIVVQFASKWVEQGFKELTNELTKQGIDAHQLEGSFKDLLPIINGIAIPLIVVGCFFFLISMFGCYGVCCKNRCCLLIYAIAVTIVFVGMLGGVIYLLAAGKSIKEKAKAAVKAEIEKEYVGITSSNGISLAMNVIQGSMKCCGMDNSKDYAKAKKWEKTVTYDTASIKYKGELKIPITCCDMKGSFPDLRPKDPQCALAPTATNSHMDTGCFTKIEDYVKSYTTYYYIALAVPLVLLLIVVALSWYLWKKAGESDMGSAAKMV